MKNKEKYSDKILEIACSGKHLAIKKKTLQLVGCSDIMCSDCIFSAGLDLNCIVEAIKARHCRDAVTEWCEAEYVEPISVEKIYNEFNKFCHGQVCRGCHSSECLIKFILDKYKVIKKEVNENE